jgi:hypothetical protein
MAGGGAVGEATAKGHSHPLHKPAPVPDNDEERLAVLSSLSLLDSEPEEAFDRITRATSATLKVLVWQGRSVRAARALLRASLRVKARRWRRCAGADWSVVCVCCAVSCALPQFPITLVSLVDKERQWFKSAVGLGVKETHRDLAFCSHVVYKEGTECLVVSDTWQVSLARTSRAARVV